jgi:DNA-binding NarL/FixJ family response regulator
VAELISVLLVDDNPTFLRVATRYLQQQEDMIVVGVAPSGEKGLAEAIKLQPKIVLLDLAMPDLSGLELIPRLKEAHPGICIIALTVLNTEGYRRAALEAGADEFLPKAVMATELLPTIRRLAENNSNQETK